MSGKWRLDYKLRELLCRALDPLIERLPVKLPDAEEESLPEELRCALEKIRTKISPPEITEEPELEQEVDLLSRIRAFFTAIVQRWQSFPKWLRICLVSVVPMVSCYFILSFFIVSSTPEVSKEDHFRHIKGKPLIRLTYIRQWPASVAFSQLLAQILRDNLNTDVIFKPVSIDEYTKMWTMLVNNHADLSPSVIYPTNRVTVDDARGEILDLGPYMIGARMGLVVPYYVDVDSIKELKSAEFSGVIYGIDPDSLLNKRIGNAIEDYGLTGFRLVEKNDRYMLSQLVAAIKDKKTIVVGVWSPHWIFGAFKLKFLSDPLGVMGKPQSMHMVCSNDFAENFPQLVEKVRRIRLTSDQLSEIIAGIKEEKVPGRAVYNWILAHRNIVKSWLHLPEGN